MPTTLGRYQYPSQRPARQASNYFLKKLGEIALKKGAAAARAYAESYSKRSKFKSGPKPKVNVKKKSYAPNYNIQVTRAKYTKHGLPSTFQKVSKPVRGNAYRPKGVMVKYRKKDPRVKSMRYRYTQGYRITQYILNGNVSFLSSGQIKTKDKCIVQGGLKNHYKLMVWNTSPVVTPHDNKLGNQRQNTDQNWVFSSNLDNSNLQKGYHDVRDQNGDGTPTIETIGDSANPNVITVSGIPFSGNSSTYEVPNHIQKAINVNISVELYGAALEQPCEIFFKVIRATKPQKYNLDLSDNGEDPVDATQAALWQETTQSMCNSHITDKETWNTIFLYRKKVPGSTFSKGVKRFQIKKLIRLMYNRTSSYMHTDLTNRTDKIGEAILPNLDRHDDKIANQTYAILGVRQLDDNKVQYTQKNISTDSDIKNLQLANDINIVPTQNNENWYRISGFITSVFAARDIEKNSSLHASTITDLHTRLSALESSTSTHTDTTGHHQHPDLTGTWNHSTSSVTLTVTASSTAGIDYDVARSDGVNLTWIDDGNHITMRNQSTGAQNSWMLNTAGTIITIQDGSQYTKQ